MTYNAKHGYVATVATSPDAVSGDYIDVSVTEAEPDWNIDNEGNKTCTPMMGSTVVWGPVETDVHVGDPDNLAKAEQAAERLLGKAGWEAEEAWEVFDNHLQAVVKRS